MKQERKTIDLCQECHEKVRDYEYFPNAERIDTCGLCGQHALVARVRKDEADRMSDKLRLAAAIEALVPGGPGISLDIAFIRVCSCGMSQVTVRAPLDAEMERLRKAAQEFYDAVTSANATVKTGVNRWLAAEIALRAALGEPPT